MTQDLLLEQKKLKEKITNNSTNARELFLWRGNENYNICHLLVAKKDSQLFKKITKILSKEEITTLLLSKNDLGDYPLHLAVWTGQLEFINLFSNYMDSFDVEDLKKRTPLMLSVKNQKHHLINTILLKTSNINSQDISGKTALHYCSQYADKNTFDLLVNCGADRNKVDAHDVVANCPAKNDNSDKSISVADIVNLTKKQRF